MDLEVRIWSLRGAKGKLTKEHGRNCITSKLLRMSTGRQGHVQKLTNFLEILTSALFFILCPFYAFSAEGTCSIIMLRLHLCIFPALLHN